jgi:hypothetical protein
MASESEQLLRNYFSRPTVKPWMRPLESQAYAQTFLWLAGLISDEQQKAKLINHSFPFPFLIQQALNRVE